MRALCRRIAEAEPAGRCTPVTVPGRYQYLKWWKLVLVILGVWIAAAEVGLSLFYWWYHTIDKTAAVFMVLVYVVACAVGGVLLAMVAGQAADLGVVPRGDVGAVCLRRRRGAPVRLLLLRADGSLSGRRHPVLTHGVGAGPTVQSVRRPTSVGRDLTMTSSSSGPVPADMSQPFVPRSSA